MFHFLTSTAPTVDVSGLTSSITGALSGVFTFDNLVIILIAALGITAGLAIGWFGYRLITRKAMGAFKKGRL